MECSAFRKRVNSTIECQEAASLCEGPAQKKTWLLQATGKTTASGVTHCIVTCQIQSKLHSSKEYNTTMQATDVSSLLVVYLALVAQQLRLPVQQPWAARN